MGAISKLDIEMPSRYSKIKVIRDIVRTFFTCEKIKERDKVLMVSVVDELVTNIVEHAYNEESEDNIIKLVMILDEIEKVIRIIVEDYGKGLPDIIIGKEEGGLGLDIIKSISDSIEITKKEKGTKIEIIKKVDVI